MKKIDLETVRTLLELYNDFLLKNRYTDADIYAEEPTAIERFFHSIPFKDFPQTKKPN